MLGTLRFFLAILVVYAHLCNKLLTTGHFAVYTFFILSGYLITYIVKNKYGKSLKGLKLYAQTRILRIYPTYLFALVVSVAIFLFIPSSFLIDFYKTLQIPNTLSSIAKNIFIFGLDSEEAISILPQTWTLYIELVYYILIALFFARSKKASLLLLLFGILFHSYYLLTNPEIFKLRHFLIPAAALPFGLGICLCHYKKTIEKLLLNSHFKKSLLLIVLLYIANIGITIIPPTHYILDTRYLPYYMNMILSTILTLYLLQINKNKFSKIDKYLGDLSYPIYLIHFTAGALIAYTYTIDRGYPLFFFGLALTIAISIVELILIKNNSEKIRYSIKTKHLNSSNLEKAPSLN